MRNGDSDQQGLLDERPVLDGDAFEALLEDLKASRGFDFTGYKRASLGRRVAKRMRDVGIDDVAAYHDHLQVHQEEFAQLFNTILINVTGFFRDAERWEYLRHEVLPRVVQAAGDGQVRVWSAGCSTGEEPYTLAILLAELLGVERFNERVKIYATDVDDDALTQARRAQYDHDALEGVPEELRARYFEPAGTRVAVRSDLRRVVIFGRHDLVRDAPISRLHLLVCRNVLMYFNRETQGRILRHLHFGLHDEGFLFLGKAEMLLTRGELFEAVDLGHRVFRRVASAPPTLRRPPAGATGTDEAARQVRLRDAAVAAGPVAQVVVDDDGSLVLANDRARTTFDLGREDIGRPLGELELSYRPVDLRTPVEEVRRGRRTRQLHDVQRRLRTGETQHFDVRLVPLVDDDRLLGVSITFDDVTGAEALRGRLLQANQELEATSEELQSTNEELQSTIEELETTNEELQSTNEELETMNEELQSASAEQAAINHEVMVRTEEIEQLNAYLRSIVSSVDVGVVVVGTDFDVQIWNDAATELWGLREGEVVGQLLLNLDIGLDVAALTGPVKQCLGSGTTASRTMTATNRRGQQIDLTVRLTPLLDHGGQRQGVVVLMGPAAAERDSAWGPQ